MHGRVRNRRRASYHGFPHGAPLPMVTRTVKRARWRGGLLALGACVALSVGLGALAHEPLGRAFHAGYQAFFEAPEGRSEGPPPSAHEGAPAPALRPDGLIDAELARDFEEAHSAPPVDGSEASLSALSLPSLRVPVSRRTLRFVRYLTEEPQGRRAFSERLVRFGRYRDILEPALREAGLPEELAWVAAVESGFDPRATSPAGAVGLWQFMPETGAAYGLEQSAFVDERRAVGPATRAAVAHLRDLFERFGRWDLALAAYNMGAGGVAEAMVRAAEALPEDARRRPLGVAELAQTRAIPKETASYVPLIMAFAIVATNRARFGFDGVELAPPLATADMAVPAGTRLSTVARAAGVPTSVLRDINPEFLHDRAPSGGGDVLVHVPADSVGRVIATFPAYAENEVVDEGPEPPMAVPSADLGIAFFANGGGDDPSLDAPLGLDLPQVRTWASLRDPLPKRASWLGENRVPELDFANPFGAPARFDGGAALVLAGGRRGGRSLFDLIPPELLRADERVASLAVRPASRLGPVRADAQPLVREAVVPRGGALTVPPVATSVPERNVVREEPRPSPEVVRLRDGTTLVVTSDSSAVDVLVEARLDDHALGANAPLMTHGVSLRVARKDVDVALSMALARLRMDADPASEVVAAQRRAALRTLRNAVAREPYGASWLALADALFPPGSPFEGRVLGARFDAQSALASLLLDARAAAPSRTLALSGDIDRARAQTLVEKALQINTRGVSEAPPQAADETVRVRIDASIPDTRVLLGWLAPGDGEGDDAALRVALDLMFGKRSVLRERLVLRTSTLAELRGEHDLGDGLSAVAVELTPAAPNDAEGAERALREALAEVVDQGLEEGAVAEAKSRVIARILAEKEASSGAVPAFAPKATVSARVRLGLRPERADALLVALSRVTAESATAALSAHLRTDPAAVIVTEPRDKSFDLKPIAEAQDTARTRSPR